MSDLLNIDQLTYCVADVMQASRIPVLALAIVVDRSIVYARGFGVTSLEDGGLPVTAQTLFRIGSTTKSLTGTAAMRLVEQGRLELDAPIKKYSDTWRFTRLSTKYEHLFGNSPQSRMQNHPKQGII